METQRYLCSVWRKVRAKLHREEIRIFGIRLAEPHHDGTETKINGQWFRSFACGELFRPKKRVTLKYVELIAS